MLQRNIIFLFLFFSIPSYSLAKEDNKTTQIKKYIISSELNLTKGRNGKLSKILWNEISNSSKIIKKRTLEKNALVNKTKELDNEKLKNKFYLNFSSGLTNLKDYDVYDMSTNKVKWDDRYTKMGSSIEIGFGYDFGKIRTEISYVRENGRFDEYLTYSDKSITKIEDGRGKLHKDFYFINTYYDFKDDKRVSPFIGLGFGFVNSVQDSAPFIPEYVRQVFVFQVKGGLSYKLSKTEIIFIEGFKRNANSHTTNDGLGTPYIYEAKEGFDSSGVQIGLRKIL